MGYYITEKDKELIDPILAKMKLMNENFVIPTSNPKKLLYIIRNAIALSDNYKSLRDKFRISIKETKLVFTMKQVEFNFVSNSIIILHSPTFMEIMTELFKENNLSIKDYIISPKDFDTLTNYCNNNNYIINSPSTSTLTITKNA